MIVVPRLTIVPPSLGPERAARRSGGDQVTSHLHNIHRVHVSVSGCLSTDLTIVASCVLAAPLLEGGMESDRWGQ